MDQGMFQDNAENIDSGLNLLQQHQQTLQKLQDHLQQQQHQQQHQQQQQQQQVDEHAQQPQKQQVMKNQRRSHMPEQVLQPQQQTQPEQLPVPQQQQQQQQQLQPIQQDSVNQQAFQQHSSLTFDGQEEAQSRWKQCARCSVRLPMNLLQIHLADCLTSVDMRPGGHLKVCSTAMFVCSVCAQISGDLESLRQHEQTHGTSEPAVDTQTEDQSSHNGMFMCSPCRLMFPTREILLRHVEMHRNDDERNRACRVCGELFQLAASLLRHIETRHEHVKACPCGIIFPTKQDFRHHQDFCMPVVRDPAADTESARSYQCRFCPKVFGTVQSRLQHERIHRHSGADDSQATSARALTKTLLICSLCKQEFSCKDHYRAHMRSHTGEKPYACRFCPKHFASLQGRWQHERIHKR